MLPHFREMDRLFLAIIAAALVTLISSSVALVCNPPARAAFADVRPLFKKRTTLGRGIKAV